ncbi:MAG TPA: hypothetical protein VMI52_12480 [Acetobacteraceae bacterium]|nr:hypothetical protein [Acetobacteraceae bacterium]
MPQLDFANPLTVSQIVWGGLIFGLFYLLLSRWALPKVGAVLQMREQVIEQDLETARLTQAKADEAVRELRDARKRAQAESQAAIEGALEQARKQAAEQARTMNERLEAQLAEAEIRIGAARDQAMGALRQVATETTELVVRRLTTLPADRAAVEKAVDAVLAGRGQSVAA